MKITRRTFIGTAALAGAAALAGCSAEKAPTATAEPAAETTAEPADLVLKNGNVITCKDEKDRAQAVAVKDGVLVYVGDDKGAEAYVGDGTEVVDLGGNTVTPGFIDGHIHAPGVYLQDYVSVNLMKEEPTTEAYAAAIKAFIEKNPDFPAYEARAMDLKAFPDSNPTNGWLDEVCNDKPVSVVDVSGHGTLLNSFAIQLCGITKDTPDPAGGTIYKDASGEITGYMSDCGAILGDIPEVENTEDQYKASIIEFAKEANSYGITTIDSGGDEMPRALLREMADKGELNFRVNTDFFAADPLNKDRTDEVLARLADEKQYESDFVKVTQVKFKVDGVPEGKSSYLLEPYAPEAGMAPDYVSSATATLDELSDFVTRLNAEGYTVQTHCMGDASAKLMADAVEKSIEANGAEAVKACRNKMAHCNLILEEDYKRLAEYGVIAAMQPMWFYYDPMFSPLEEQMFGKERFKTEYHIKDMLDAGLIITGSNDYPVTFDFAPLHGMEAGVKQCSPYPEEEDMTDEYTRNADQGVSMWEMLKMYTVNGAYGAFWEDMIGTLEVGKKADMVVLSEDILTCDYKKVSDTTVVRTILDGRTVYEA